MKKIYIVNNKKSFIQNLPPLTNIKVMTLKELEDKILGKYGNEARLYLYYEKNIPLNLIDVYLDTLKYLNGEDLNEKIKMLNEIKKDLIDKNLYFFDEIFINSLSGCEITFYNFVENKHLDKIIKILEEKCKVNKTYKEVPSPSFVVHQYATLEEEVDDVIYKIMNLLEQGVSINNIKLMNVNNEYYPCLTRIFNQYKLPFINLYDCTFDTSNYVINFINNLNKYSVKESIKLLDNNDYDQQIINIINDYAFLDDIELAKEFIIKDLKNIKIKKDLKTDYLELVDLKYNIKEDDKIFFLGLNNGIAPSIYEDSDLITDDEYEKLGELTSSLKTNLSEKELIIILNKCYYISYKLTSLSNKHIPSYIISKYNINNEIHSCDNHILYDKKYYSLDVEKFNYTIARDHYFKTKEKTKKYECLSYNFKEFIDNKKYDFTGISKESLKDKLDGKFTLSYTSLNTYYKCKFRYYLNSIINLNKYESTLATIRGKVYHKLLEECDNPDFDYDRVFYEEIKQAPYDNKILFFTSLIYDEFKIIKEFNEEFRESSKLKNIIREHKIEFHKMFDDYDITIKGFIDKVIYDDDCVAIIDYKSGKSDTFKLDNLYYGLDLQLPMYAYYASNDETLKEKRIAGLYLQHIYNHFNDRKLKDVNECKKFYRLTGYTNAALEDIVTNNKTMFLANSKNSYSSLVINNIAKFTEHKIEEAIKGIIDGDFEINPHTIEKKNDSCQYCEYKDICFFKGRKKDYPVIDSSYFLSDVDDRTILLNCIKLFNDDEINIKCEEILNENSDINVKLLHLIMSNNPNEKILKMLDLLKKGKDGE